MRSRRRYNKAWRRANPESVRQSCRKWYATNREQQNKRVAAWRKANPEKCAQMAKDWRKRNRFKILAHLKLHYALKCSRIAKKPCAKCGSLIVEAHHSDYTKPLEVTWLCHLHHKHEHRKNNTINAIYSESNKPTTVPTLGDTKKDGS